MEYYAVTRFRRRLLVVAFACMALGVLCLSFIGCSMRTSQVALVGAQVADLHSTHQAVTSGRGHEVNPLMGDGTGIRPIAMKAVSTAALLYYGVYLERRGHGTAAVVMQAIAATAIALVAGRNYSIAWGK